jgi:hypothetical protein
LLDTPGTTHDAARLLDKLMTMIARHWMLPTVAGFGTAMLALTAVSFAQGGDKKAAPSPKDQPVYGEIHLSTSIGSFRMLEFNDDKPPEGHFEMTFTGTVLVDTTDAVPNPRGLTTKVTVSGKVRKEVSYHGRDVYFGTGKIVVDGGWHALQWFGRDMQAYMKGCGVFRVNGEFDKNLETGFYWYADGKKMDWGTGGNQPTVPASVYAPPKPNIKINGKGGG